MKHITIHHHIKGILFYDKNRKRRYAVNYKSIVIDVERELDQSQTYYAELKSDDSEYFQQSLIMDDLDEVIYMARTIIYGVTIMNYQVINDNPNNFRALINDGLELHIHHEDGVTAMPGLPNIELLKEYWKKGVHKNAGENAAEVERLLRYVEPVPEEKPKKKTL